MTLGGRDISNSLLVANAGGSIPCQVPCVSIVNGAVVDLYLAQAREYLKGNVAAGAWSDVVWSLANDKLVAADVPALLYPAELAKGCAAAALRIAPSSLDVRSTFASACLAQANLIDQGVAGGDEAMKPLEAVSHSPPR